MDVRRLGARWFALAVLGMAAMAGLVRCGADAGGRSDDVYGTLRGGEGEACYANQTCDRGFACVGSRCVAEPQGGKGQPCRPDDTCDDDLVCTASRTCLSCEPGSEGCTCEQGGICAGRLACVDGVCREALPIPGAPPLPGWSAALEADCHPAGWVDVETAPGCGLDSPVELKAHARPVGLIHWDDDVGLPPGTDPKVSVAGVRWCTGVLVSEGLFLAAAACFDRDKVASLGWTLPPKVASADDFCRHLHVDFACQVDAETGAVYVNNGHEGTSYRCDRVVELEPNGLPYVLVELGGCPGKTYGVAAPAPAPLAPGDPIEIVHHPFGRPKAVSCGTVTSVDGDLLTVDVTDLAGGSPGGAILGADGALAGLLLRAGCTSDAPAYGLPVARVLASSRVLPDLLFDPLETVVDHVTPDRAAAGLPYRFSVLGANLPATLWAEVEGCADPAAVSIGASRATFTCVPELAADLVGRILEAKDGPVLLAFTVKVEEQAAYCQVACTDVTCGQAGPCDCGACTGCEACGDLERCLDDVCVADCEATCDSEGAECGVVAGCDCGGCLDFQACDDPSTGLPSTGLGAGGTGGTCAVDCPASCELAHRGCGPLGPCDCGGCGLCASCCDGACVTDCDCLCASRGAACGEVEGCTCGSCPADRECRSGECREPAVIHAAYWEGSNCIVAGDDARACLVTSGLVGEVAHVTAYDDDDYSLPEIGPTFDLEISPHDYDASTGRYVTCFTWAGVCAGMPGYCIDGGDEGDEPEFYLAVDVAGVHFESPKAWSQELNVGDHFVPSGEYCHD